MTCVECENFFAKGIIAALEYFELNKLYGKDEIKFESMNDLATRIFDATWDNIDWSDKGITTCGDFVKEIKEFCKKGAIQSAKDSRDSVDTAASFANGSEVVFLKVLEMIVEYEKGAG
jgi:hypothetical protein